MPINWGAVFKTIGKDKEFKKRIQQRQAQRKHAFKVGKSLKLGQPINSEIIAKAERAQEFLKQPWYKQLGRMVTGRAKEFRPTAKELFKEAGKEVAGRGIKWLSDMLLAPETAFAPGKKGLTKEQIERARAEKRTVPRRMVGGALEAASYITTPGISKGFLGVTKGLKAAKIPLWRKIGRAAYSGAKEIAPLGALIGGGAEARKVRTTPGRILKETGKGFIGGAVTGAATAPLGLAKWPWGRKGTKIAKLPPKRTPFKEGTKKVISPVSKVPKELEPLAREARKYKSAEEFVNYFTKNKKNIPLSREYKKYLSEQQDFVSREKAIYSKLKKLKNKYKGIKAEEATPSQIKQEKIDREQYIKLNNELKTILSKKTLAKIPETPIKIHIGEKELRQQLKSFYNQAVKGVKEVKPVSKIVPEAKKFIPEAISKKKLTIKDFKTDDDWYNFGEVLSGKELKGLPAKQKDIVSLAKKYNTTQEVIEKAINRYQGFIPKIEGVKEAKIKVPEKVIRRRAVGEIGEQRVGGRPQWWKTELPKEAKEISVEGKEAVEATPFMEWIGMKPMREIGKRHPVAGDIVKMGREAQLGYAFERQIGWDKAESFFKGLSEKEGALAVNIQEQGIKNLSKYPEKIQKAVKGMRWFNKQIKEMARKEFGIDTSKWGFTEENYFHHMWTGDQAVVADGKIIGFGKMKDAFKLAQQYKAVHKTANVVIKPKFVMKDTPTTLLSQKGFWSFVNKIADRVAVTPEELLQEMRGVAAIKPRAKFVGAFLPRKANLENYIKNPEYVYKTLWNRISRKKWFEPFSRKATFNLSKIENPALRNEIAKYIEAVSGKFYEPVSVLGVDISRLTSVITKLESYLKLGYRPSTAFVNRLQPLQMTYPIIGNDLFRGSLMRFTKLGRKLIRQSKILAEQPKYYAGEFIPARKEKLWNFLYLFGKAEQANREETLLGGYLFAKRKFGFDNKKALEFGKDLVAATQFIYDASDIPRIMRSPIGRMAFQFRPFVINYLYNAKNILLGKELGGLERYGIKLSKMDKTTRAIKWLGANFAVGGLRTISMLGKYASVGFLSYLAIKHPKVFQGALNYAGIDISARAGANPMELIPESGWELLGILPGDIQKFYKAIKKKDFKEAMKISPMAWNVYQALTVEKEAAVQPTTYERILTAAGFKPARLSTVREAQRYIKYLREDQRTSVWQMPTKKAIQNMIYNIQESKTYTDEKKKEIIREILKQLKIPESDYPYYLEQRKIRMRESRKRKEKQPEEEEQPRGYFKTLFKSF